ncbi:hypothetical protein MTR67_034827, partial [Solanum verrucosum]
MVTCRLRIFKRIGNVAYELELQPELAVVHPNRKLRTKEVALVNVLWRKQFVEEDTWEAEEYMKKRYPYLFPSREIPDQGGKISADGRNFSQLGHQDEV